MTIENNIINYAKIDQNGEIIVPKTSVIGESENILIRKENDLTFSIYDLIEYKKILEKLKKESEEAKASCIARTSGIFKDTLASTISPLSFADHCTPMLFINVIAAFCLAPEAAEAIALV